MAKTRSQRRQVFWRRGMSTSEQQRSAPTGRTAQTVAQQPGRPRRVGARGGHEGPEVQSGPSPSACSAYAITPSRDNEEAVDGGAPVDAQNAPTAAWESRQEREIPTPPTAIILFLITTTGSERPGEKSPDFYASTWLATVIVGAALEVVV